MRKRPGIITRREIWWGYAVYRWWMVRNRVRRLWYRLGGRCYACPGSYGRHKFSCSVGIKETLR